METKICANVSHGCRLANCDSVVLVLANKGKKTFGYTRSEGLANLAAARLGCKTRNLGRGVYLFVTDLDANKVRQRLNS
jgi:hypothetical protein